MEWETERILMVELKMKENVMIIATYGSNENEITCDKEDFCKKIESRILRTN